MDETHNLSGLYIPCLSVLQELSFIKTLELLIDSMIFFFFLLDFCEYTFLSEISLVIENAHTVQ